MWISRQSLRSCLARDPDPWSPSQLQPFTLDTGIYIIACAIKSTLNTTFVWSTRFVAQPIQVRLHFAAGCTTDWTKRFEYSYNKQTRVEVQKVIFQHYYSYTSDCLRYLRRKQIATVGHLKPKVAGDRPVCGVGRSQVCTSVSLSFVQCTCFT